MKSIKVYDKTIDKMYSSEEYHISLDLTNKVVRINESQLDYEKGIKSIILYPTGVKDINKKESYLGDIIKKSVPTYGKLNEREKISFGIVKKEKNSNNMYVEWNYKSSYEGKTYWGINKQGINIIEEHEIVGYIYNNADLIKKEV